MRTIEICWRPTVALRVAEAMALAVALAWLPGCSKEASVQDAGTRGDGLAPADTSSADGSPRLDAVVGGDATAPGLAPRVRSKATYTVETTRAVVYAKGVVNSGWGTTAGTGRSLLLDTFAPKGHTDGLRPAILFIHGGGFKSGSRGQAALVAQAKYLVARGWFAASIDYRLAGTQGTIPSAWAQAVKRAAPQNTTTGNAMYLAGRDAKAAVRWLHANTAKYRVDPNHIAVAGGSAGAMTAVGIGASAPADFRDELTSAQDRTRASTHLQASAKVAAIVDYWGGPGLIKVLAAVDGKRRFGAGDPPLMIVHGTADPTVKFSQAQELEREWKATGVPYEFYPLTGKGHGAWNAKHKGKTLVELAFDFLVAKQRLVVR